MKLDAARLVELAMNALETTAFMITDPVEPGAALCHTLHSSILIEGPDESRQLLLSASEGFLTELASNMLGTDPDQVTAGVEGLQALMEFANILGGEVVMALGGAQDPRYVLGLPRVLATGEVAPVQERAEACFALESLGEHLQVHLARASQDQ